MGGVLTLFVPETQRKMCIDHSEEILLRDPVTEWLRTASLVQMLSKYPLPLCASGPASMNCDLGGLLLGLK